MLTQYQESKINCIVDHYAHKIFAHTKNTQLSLAIIKVIQQNRLLKIKETKPNLILLLKQKPILEEAIEKLNLSLNMEDTNLLAVIRNLEPSSDLQMEELCAHVNEAINFFSKKYSKKYSTKVSHKKSRPDFFQLSQNQEETKTEQQDINKNLKM